MSEARDVLDRLTAAVVAKDAQTVAGCYAEDAVAVTPDEGELRGRERIAEYMSQFGGSFPDLQYKYLQKHDAGNVAIDEGYLIGTNTGPLLTPSGETIPPQESRSTFEAVMLPPLRPASSRSIVSTSTRWSS